MLVAAALVPDTVLLVPGVAGRAPEDPDLVALRAAAAGAVVSVVPRAVRIVVVAPGRVTRSVGGRVRAGAGAIGVPDHLLVEAVPELLLRHAPGTPVSLTRTPGTALAGGAVVGVRLALAAGVDPGTLHVVEVAPGAVADLRALGAALTAPERTALVVVGSGSVRHGPGAPLPADDRAAAVDDALVAAYADAGRARDALAGLDADVAAALGTSGWAPWQVLVGALDAAGSPGGTPRVDHAAVWRGAAHAAVQWPVAP